VIRHLLKLTWNRKRANALIVVEMFFSFLVVFGVLTAAVTGWQRWNQPLGFDWRNVLQVDMELGHRGRDAEKELHAPVMRMLDELRALPQVESAALSLTPPYGGAQASSAYEVNGRSVPYTFDDVSDGYADVMRIRLVKGRWFTREDDASTHQPVVVDTNAARALFGDADPIGRKMDEEPPPGWKEKWHGLHVIGVVEPFRKGGETAAPDTMVFRRYAANGEYGILGRSLMVRVHPGTPGAFEETVIKRLQQVAPGVTFTISPLPQTRAQSLRLAVAPIAAAAIVGLFLIAMVALGLTGVLWQNVTRRTRELALRRAVGAPGAAVHRQVLAEVILLASFALVAGAIVILQLPILGAFSVVTPSAFTTGFAAAVATIYLLTVLCGLYPSWLASRLEPADALRYE
jgi:putative ABC transport system permease protein